MRPSGYGLTRFVLIRDHQPQPQALTRLHAELTALLNDKVHQEYVRAFRSATTIGGVSGLPPRLPTRRRFRLIRLRPNSQHSHHLLPLAGGRSADYY